MTSRCGHWSLQWTTDTRREIAAFRCKRWDCENCNPLRRWMLKQLAIEGAPERFITLTLPSRRAADPDKAAQLLVHAWRMIVQAWKRHHPADKIEYLCVFEETKKGTPHLHILERGPYIPHAWLSRQMQDRANAPVVDIRRVNSAKHVAVYISKYISKAPEKYHGCKRYWRTMHWRTFIPDQLPRVWYWLNHCQRRRLPIGAVISEAEAEGWKIAKESNWHASLTHDPPPYRPERLTW